MSFLRSDLPLNRDASGRFLPWIIGFMVYLAALAVAATMALDGVVSRWQIGLSGTLTVQVPPSPDEDAARIDRVIEALSRTPAVASIELMDDGDVARLLKPWLGSEAGLADLPLPDLIAVELRPDAKIDLDSLRRRLEAAAPGTLADDHARWLADLMAVAHALDLLAGVVLALIGAAAVVTVVYATTTGLSIHRRFIELVHLIGAKDAYIARQFEAHALRLGLAGGIAGAGLATLTLFGLARLLDGIEAPLLPSLSLRPWQWLTLALLPFAAAGIAMLTARVTVLRSLNRVM